MQDRPYQVAAENETIAEYDQGTRRMLLVMATGTGKTVVFSRLYERLKSRLPGRMLVLAHTEELVHQNATKLQTVNPDVKVSIEMGNLYADPEADIISASVQSLGRKDTKRGEKFNWDKFDKIIVDEAHHATTDAYKRVLESVGAFTPDSSKLLLGCTATSQRADGVGLSSIFEKVSYVYPLRNAIKDGWLVDLRGYRVVTDTSLTEVSSQSGDFSKSELALTVNNSQRNEQIVEAWKKCGQNRRTLVFCVDIQHSKDLAQEFLKQGISAEGIWGDDPQRAEKLKGHRGGLIRVLCNCAVLTEGYDDPNIGCVVLARPTQSSVLFSQMVGRVTRLDPMTGNIKEFMAGSKEYQVPFDEPKKDGIIIDVVDLTSRHSLITLPSLMGIQSTFDLQGASLLEAVEELEELQDKHPEIDFTKVNLLDKVPQLIEQIDLMQVRFPAEVESNSELIWFRAVAGGYRMTVPKEYENKPAGSVHIFENAIGRWELNGLINGEKFHGTRLTMEEMFKIADEQIRERVTQKTLNYVKREATWHNKPVTKGQIKMLTRLFPHRAFPIEHMTAGQASKIISERLSRRVK